MNSRYKFRAFDKETDSMIYDVQDAYDGLSSDNNSFELNEEYSYVCCFSEFIDSENFILMQCTGLKDKNGIEIYEGDIVLVSDGIDSYVTVVYWGGEEYPAFDLSYKYIPRTWFYDCNVLSAIANSTAEKIEVVGNIYENRKLLDEQ